VATVLVRNGTLQVGDYFICGSVFGKVRAMFDDRGQPLREAEPSMPAEVLGSESLPEVGDTFQVVTDTAKAKQIVIYREAKAREVAMSKTNRITLEQLHEQLKEGESQGAQHHPEDGRRRHGGSADRHDAEAVERQGQDPRAALGRGRHQRDDVLLASASNAIIVGFNVSAGAQTPGRWRSRRRWTSGCTRSFMS
jgi:translation initiation factor IF-2